MTATNHALTGALIALVSGNPYVAVPAALLSHFVCDAIPHFGRSISGQTYMRSQFFKRLLIADGSLCIVLVLILIIVRPEHWFLACACAFIATSPDLLWFANFKRANSSQKIKKPNWFLRFAAWIQWYERPLGAFVEVIWFAGILVLLRPYLLG